LTIRLFRTAVSAFYIRSLAGRGKMKRVDNSQPGDWRRGRRGVHRISVAV